MARSILIPRINNNDDEVRVVALHVARGDQIARGQMIGEIETDKSVMEIEAEFDGIVIAITAEIDAMIAVGSPLFWIGDRADEPVPTQTAPPPSEHRIGASDEQPTGKALILLRKYGLDAAVIPRDGPRLRAEDV